MRILSLKITCMRKLILPFIFKITVVNVLSTFLVGSIFFLFLTKGMYTGDDGSYSGFMRNPEESDQWIHVSRWFFLGQVIKGILMGLALLPFYYTLMEMKRSKRFLVLLGIYVIFGFWAAFVAAPGNIEGLIYLKPDIGLKGHLFIQPHMLLQALLISGWLSMWMGKKAEMPYLEK